MTTISNGLQVVMSRIAAAAAAADRSKDEVELIAVSKTWGAQRLQEVYAAGQRCFGESYLQEALKKMAALRELDIEWHFIGALQSNKTRTIAEHFAWVHTVDRLDLAERLAKARPASAGPLNVCLQINISAEPSKRGICADEAADLAARVAGLHGIRLRGLMAIPRATPDLGEQRAQFSALRQLYQRLNAGGLSLDTLSMGMSNDLEAAIAEGATLVRVGTALFGKRDAN